MKTKTATIKIYQMWGTTAFCADVSYRGKLLVCFDGHDFDYLKSMAKRWAKNRDFTHTKLIIG